MREQFEGMAQWELEATLGQLINLALHHRESAEHSEQKSIKARKREAEAIESIRECRKHLGLMDGPIGRSHGQGDDDQAPLSTPCDAASGFEPLQQHRSGE